MNIESLTVGQVRELQKLLGGSSGGKSHSFEIMLEHLQ